MARGESMTNKKNIGYVGLGNTGKPSAEHLVCEIFNADVFDVYQPGVDELEERGAIGCASVAELAAKCEYIGICVRDDAQVDELLYGGRPAHLPKGYYVEPNVFMDITSDMTIAREEIFGPVLAVIAYDDEEDAIRIANDSDYGQSGSVWSADEERALRVAKRVRTGTVNVNGGNFFAADIPFSGYKQSGIGREMGADGFEEYLETKSIAVSGV
jgi:acyl-CoA reductase-like NAD-dependent aldehyde dehydrogenase